MVRLTTGKTARAFAVAAILGLLLAGCASTSEQRLVSLPVPQTPPQTGGEPATQREHARFLFPMAANMTTPACTT